jgi:hypothetical protein
MEPRDLLKALMERDGLNPNSLAAGLKNATTQPQIQKFLTGTTKEPRRNTLQPIADHYGFDVEAFYNPTLAHEIAGHLNLLGDAIRVAREPEAPNRTTYPGGQRGLRSITNEIVIPKWDTAGSMGSGLLLQDQPGVIHSIKVSPEWVHKNIPHCSSPKNLCIVTGFGPSMKGMYNSGDPLVCDQGIKTVEYDGVYFFRVGKEGFIKILQRIPGMDGKSRLKVKSKNVDYDDWYIEPDMEFEVFGRIVKAWRGEDF